MNKKNKNYFLIFSIVIFVILGIVLISLITNKGDVDISQKVIQKKEVNVLKKDKILKQKELKEYNEYPLLMGCSNIEDKEYCVRCKNLDIGDEGSDISENINYIVVDVVTYNYAENKWEEKFKGLNIEKISDLRKESNEHIWNIYNMNLNEKRECMFLENERATGKLVVALKEMLSVEDDKVLEDKQEEILVKNLDLIIKEELESLKGKYKSYEGFCQIDDVKNVFEKVILASPDNKYNCFDEKDNFIVSMKLNNNNFACLDKNGYKEIERDIQKGNFICK